MNTENILKFNDRQFIKDIKAVKDVMVVANKSNAYLHVPKNEVLKEAESEHIHYYITDSVFIVKRDVMIIF